MKNLLRLLGVLTIASSLTACATTTLQPSQLNGSGYFETKTLVTEKEVVVSKPFDKQRYSKLAYVQTEQKIGTMNKFFVTSFENMKVFDKVADKDYLEKEVITRHLEAKVPSVVDNMIGLHNLATEMGPFLLIHTNVEWNGGYDYDASIKATDPVTTEVVFEVHKKAFNWAGLDQPLFYPMMNAFLDWANARPVHTAPSTETPPDAKKAEPAKSDAKPAAPPK